MKKLKILFFQPDYSRYPYARYHYHFLLALKRVHEIFPYGPGFEGYNLDHTIDDVLRMCPFNPDLICFGAGWEWEWLWGHNPEEFDPHPAINVANIGIPAVQILNKEYKKLNKKFEFIRRNNIQIVFTAHHYYSCWEDRLGVKFVHFPFAVNSNLFRDYELPKQYDFGFSGSLHVSWTDLRARIKEHLFWAARYKLHPYLEFWLYKLDLVKRIRYRGIDIYWGQWRGGTKFGSEYARLINSSKIWLATLSAKDLVGTRFYEIMASRSLLFCNRSPVYEGLFNAGEHCVMFENDLSDFDDKLFLLSWAGRRTDSNNESSLSSCQS